MIKITMEISKATLGIAAGVAGTLFLGYCIYFDQKRRKDPDYKKKVRERRRRTKKAAAGSRSEMPNFNDKDAVQRYFLQEIQIGEAFISNGDIERGVEHLANAVIVCGQPTQLLHVLQQTLPAQVFILLVQKMKEHGNRMTDSNQRAIADDLNDDLE